MSDRGRDPTGQDQGSTKRVELSFLANLLAMALIAVYLVALGLQWFAAGLDEPEWSRRLHLLGGLEALAFAGAGAVLGTTIQRQVTRKAEEEAAEAKTRANQNQSAAEKGRALHALALTKAQQASEPATRDLDQATVSGDGGLSELVELGNRYDAMGS
jgi:hypothetical protein